jgi:hypothetical protein
VGPGQAARLKPDAAHNWTFLLQPGLVCGASAVVLAAAQTAVAVLAGVRSVKDEIELGCDAAPAGVAFVVIRALDR